VAEAVMLRETRVRKRVSGKVQKIGVYCNSYRTVSHRKKLNKRQKRRTNTNTNKRHGSNEIHIFFHLYEPHFCGHDEDNYVIIM
jgi:hypothetical protein